jgi:hypothetical protein
LHTPEALKLVKFLVRRDVQEMRAKEHPHPPTGLTLFELPPILKAYPELAKSTESRARLVVRPSVSAGAKYENVTKACIRAVHSVLVGEKISSVAAAELEKELVEITGFRTGSPSK